MFRHADPHERVTLVALGPLNSKVCVERLAVQLNDWQTYYRFESASPLVALPFPEVPRDGNNFPAFHPDQLFSHMDDTRRPENGNAILAGIIDSELFDDLYSTTDRNNSAILVSLRTTHLTEVLADSGKSYHEYVALELSAQLLAIQYRRAASLSCDPCECCPPWHKERLSCLFDYYGLTAGCVAKLMEPKLSARVLAELETLEVGRYAIDATMSIANRVSRRHARELLSFARHDMLSHLLLGGLIGAAASQAVELPARTTAVACIAAACALALRMAAYWRRGR